MITYLLIILALGVILLLFLGLIAYFIVKDDAKNVKKVEEKNPTFSTDLEQMIITASNESLSDNALKELATLFVKTHKLGTKNSETLDENTKKKLEFISAFSANAKASAKTISFLNKELKKISNSYKKEIDAYEQMGLAKRKIKEK